jgi:hypothetical protein
MTTRAKALSITGLCGQMAYLTTTDPVATNDACGHVGSYGQIEYLAT